MQSVYKYRFDRRTIYWTLVYVVVFSLLGGGLYYLYEGGYRPGSLRSSLRLSR